MEHIYPAFERGRNLIMDDYLTTGVHNYYNLENASNTEIRGTITFITPEVYPACIWVGKKIAMYEGKNIVGYATITEIFNPVLNRKIDISQV